MTQEKKKWNILIVDDDKFLLDMYSTKFGEYNFEVSTALGSVDAVELLSSTAEKPDVILLDVVMPTMDGFEFLEKIKADGLAPKSKLIILSNLGQEGDIKRGKSLGASDYIVKASATPTEVVKKVVKLLEGK